MRARLPLRRELLLGLSVLFTGAILTVLIGLGWVLPYLGSPFEAALLIFVLILAELLLLFGLGGHFLRRLLVKPMENLAIDVRRIAAGEYHHRVGEAESAELRDISESVNAMADRLVTDQERLSANVFSLDQTNQDLVEARDQVVHSARLASVGTLAAGIAHEVGNPLGAILGYVDVAKNRMVKSGGDTDLLDCIRDEAKRIDRIVRGLLDYARPSRSEAGPAPPAAVLTRVRELLSNQGRFDRVRHEWTSAGEIPDVVMEAQQLEQVLVNLVLNALDALGGTEDPWVAVRLSAEAGAVAKLPIRREQDPPGINYMHRRRVSKDKGGKGIDPLFTARHVVVVDVEDNGPGVPEGELEKVFDPFYTTKELGKGTGLGLSICARLVEGMGGRIHAANRPGGGARFTIRLPGAPDGASVAAPENGKKDGRST